MQLTAVFLGIGCSTNHRSQTGWASLKLKETYIFTLQYSVWMTLYILILFNHHSSSLAQAQHFNKMYVRDWLENCGGRSGDKIAYLCKLYHHCCNTLHFPWKSISQCLWRKKKKKKKVATCESGCFHWRSGWVSVFPKTDNNPSKLVKLNCINWRTNIRFSPLVTWKKSKFNAARHLNSCGGTKLG